MRLLTFFATLAMLFASVRANGQTTNSLHSSIEAIDRLLTNTPPGGGEVQVDDMRFSKTHMQAWRDYLQSRLNGGNLGLQGAFNYSGSTTWPGGVVPYVYQTTGPEAMSVAKQALVESAMREWQQVASLNFVPRTTEQNYILFNFSGDAAGAPMNSHIGMKGGVQILNVAGWGNKLNCAHELGHAMGMIHEQSRSDRDTFVTVNFDNINPDNAHNFTLLPSSINRTSYDFDSMMHYNRNAFARTNGLITISANSPNQIWSDGAGPQEIGQRSYLSAGDKAAMGLQYGNPLTISGHIQDAAGNPLSGVVITLQSANVYRGQNPVTTDINGNYTFTGIPRNTGNYTITPSQLGATFTIASQTVDMVTTSQTTINFVQTDSAPPGLIITNPVPSGIYSTLLTAGGTASDDGGIKEVRVALARTSDLVWWNWVTETWGTTTFDWATNVKIATGTADWGVSLPSLSDGGYQIHVQSVDTSDNASPWLMRHFFMDPTPPSVSITQPLNNANLS
ncbi:MAG: Xanthomonalisin precursor, partial [Verrucomicrobia bacterium]|nr:Xanthomonalisin precursor [Verrucomicrobiota bacterium]